MTSTGPGLGNRVGTQFTLLPSGLRTVYSPRPDLAELPISQLSTSFISAHSALLYNIGKPSNNHVYVFIDYLLLFFVPLFCCSTDLGFHGCPRQKHTAIPYHTIYLAIKSGSDSIFHKSSHRFLTFRTNSMRLHRRTHGRHPLNLASNHSQGLNRLSHGHI